MSCLLGECVMWVCVLIDIPCLLGECVCWICRVCWVIVLGVCVDKYAMFFG
jgi:hypothetical protein